MSGRARLRFMAMLVALAAARMVVAETSIASAGCGGEIIQLLQTKLSLEEQGQDIERTEREIEIEIERERERESPAADDPANHAYRHPNSMNETSFTFVHVGKTAGGSVAEFTKKNDVGYFSIHLNQVDSCSLSQPQRWVISVRDPIDRLVSAFNWQHPSTHGWCYFEEEDFFDCFPLVNDFAEALEDQSACGSIAREFLDLNHPQVGHIGTGVAWYLQKDLTCILAQDRLVVRTEFFDQDMHGLAKLVNLTHADFDIPTVHADYPMKNQTYLSEKGRMLLGQSLKEDYEVLRKLGVIYSPPNL